MSRITPSSTPRLRASFRKEEYGAGTVIVWDQGTWEPEGNARRDYERGNLTFRLAGTRLKGRWKLVQMHGKQGEDGKNWLLIKLHDEEAVEIEQDPDRFERDPERGYRSNARRGRGQS